MTPPTGRVRRLLDSSVGALCFLALVLVWLASDTVSVHFERHTSGLYSHAYHTLEPERLLHGHQVRRSVLLGAAGLAGLGGLVCRLAGARRGATAWAVSAVVLLLLNLCEATGASLDTVNYLAEHERATVALPVLVAIIASAIAYWTTGEEPGSPGVVLAVGTVGAALSLVFSVLLAVDISSLSSIEKKSWSGGGFFFGQVDAECRSPATRGGIRIFIDNSGRATADSDLSIALDPPNFRDEALPLRYPEERYDDVLRSLSAVYSLQAEHIQVIVDPKLARVHINALGLAARDVGVAQLEVLTPTPRTQDFHTLAPVFVIDYCAIASFSPAEIVNFAGDDWRGLLAMGDERAGSPQAR